MKQLDLYLQDVRFAQAKRFIKKGGTVLDIGCEEGEMFERNHDVIGKGVGIDPAITSPITRKNYTLVPGFFPDACPTGVMYDAITMLAVLEHIPPAVQKTLALSCARFLNPGGRVIITVPSPQVDLILHLLRAVRLVDAPTLHEHYGFKTSETPALFHIPAFKMLHKEKFQLGLNNLFVFEKIN